MSVEVGSSDEQHQRLGKFVLLRPIRKGMGGMGALSLALDVEARRIVVLKRLASSKARDGELAARFRDEIGVSFRVAHPNLVRAIESGTAGDEVYLALEYIAGQDLEAVADRARRAKQPLPLAILAAVLRQLLRALEYAHAQVGFVHRDVSPSNIMIGYDGIARLVDYGFALHELKSARTIPGMSAGTLGFLAPEQRVQGATADARADLFAVGALLHFVLTGLATFAGEDPRSKDQLKARLGDRQVLVAPEMLTFLWRALQQDPNDRFQTAREMGGALEIALGEPLPDDRALGDHVSRLFSVEKRASLDEIERWRATDWSARVAPISSQQITSPVEKAPPDKRRVLVIAGVASAAVIAACVVLLSGPRNNAATTMIVTSAPPPEPRVEQLAPPKPQAPPEPEPVAPPKVEPPVAPALKPIVEVKANVEKKESVEKPAAKATAAGESAHVKPAESNLPSVASRLDEAKALARAGELTAARTLYAELADDPHARAKANTALAELEYRQGNYEQAIARANAAMRAGVATPAFFVRAMAELKGDKPADAARDFQKVLDVEPANSDAREGLQRAQDQMRRKP